MTEEQILQEQQCAREEARRQKQREEEETMEHDGASGSGPKDALGELAVMTHEEKMFWMFLRNQEVILNIGNTLRILQPKQEKVGTTPEKFKGKKEDTLYYE